MTDWTNANFVVADLYTPNKGPENGDYNFVWRAEWPLGDNTYTWTYFLNNNTSIVGFIEDQPEGNTRYYVTNGWPSNIPFAGLTQPLAEMGTVLTHDNVTGGSHDDWLFPGPGNDRLDGQGGNDQLAGGSDNDLMYGGNGNDVMHGDDFDAPIVKDEDFLNQVFEWYLPTEIDPDVIAGNDVLDGGNGVDKLYGGGDGDQLSGGPRGQGWTDVLYGGDGADAFYLSYDSSTSTSGQGFWNAYVDTYLPGIGNDAVKAGVEKLATAAAEDFFESATGSFLLGGMSTAVGDLAAEGIKMLFGMHKSPEPKPTGEDVMVVADFDPREDVLFLPLPTSDDTTLVASAVNFGASGNPHSASGQTGWGIEFTKGTSNTIYAEVFLDTGFLADFGITSNSAVTAAFIEDVFATALEIDENGIVDQQAAYPFPTSPDSYVDGVVPTVADAPIAFTAPSDTTTRVYGAFGALSTFDPAVTTSGLFMAGTNLGDILNVNPVPVAPTTILESELTTASTQVRAYSGDDIIIAGDGLDNIFGGDGNDWIYGVGHEGVETVEAFHGDDGDDLIYLGWTSMSAIADGGNGNDTASFAYVNGSVTASLSVTSTDPLNGPNATSTNNADSLISRYALTGIENLDGTPNADTLTGDSNGNTIAGNLGNDSLYGMGGVDTASYLVNPGKVVVDLTAGTASEYGADGSTVVSTDVLAGFEAAIGSSHDDTLRAGSGNNTLAGAAGNDTLIGTVATTISYAVNAGSVSIDLSAGITQENGADGGSQSATVVSQDSFSDVSSAIGSPFADSFRNGTEGGHVLNGGGGIDILRMPTSTDHGVTVDLSAGIVADNGFGKQDTLIAIEHVDGTSHHADKLTGDANDNRLRGLSGDDLLVGGDGNDSLIADDGRDTVMPGAGVDTVDLAQSATDPSDYQSKLVTGTASDWNGDVVDNMGYTDFLVVQDWTQDGTIVPESSTVLEVELSSAFAFSLSSPVFGQNVSQLVQNGDLVLSYAGAAYDSDAVGAWFGASGPVTDGGPAGELNDLLVGSGGDDTLDGRSGDDVVHGLDGSDALHGRGGEDVLAGGAGAFDVLYGGAGADRFVFGAELANDIREIDVIADFDSWPDAITLLSGGVTRYLESSNALILWAGDDEDMIIVNGISRFDHLAFVDIDGNRIDSVLV